MELNNTNLKNIAPNFPPVVSVLGHVDHGKTSLLDAVRKSDIAGEEHGGITQSIGTSEVEIEHENKIRKITFIDTPGHAAFSDMRAQGVNAADIALLIVAADDGVKPQTKEAIEKIKEASIPFIVVITKIDLESAQLDRVKQMILGEGILLEGLGGEVPWIGVSSKTGEKIKDLLDLILLVYDLSQIKKTDSGSFMGVVIDSRLDKKRGAVSTVVVKQGTISSSSKLFREEKEIGKVRALFNSNGEMVKEAKPGVGVEILGLSGVLQIGSIISDKPFKKEKIIESKKSEERFNISDFFGEKKEEGMNIILKTETSGEMEAVKKSLPKGVNIISEGQGEISQADILKAKDLNALVLGFNVGISKEAKILADNEGVFYKSYKIIYKLLEELEDAILGIGQEEQVKIRGKADIIAEFPSGAGKILGVKVTEGRLALNDPVIVVRNDTEVGRAKISLLKRGKTEVKEVAKGLECGVSLSTQIDFSIGDVLLSHSK